MWTFRIRRIACAATAACAAVVALAACGGVGSTPASSGSSSGSTSSGGTATSQGVATKAAAGTCGSMPAQKLPQDPQGALKALGLSSDVLEAYDHYANPIYRSPFASFTPKRSKPWTIGFSESYTANSWRQELDSEIRKQAATAEQHGVVKRLIFQNSNNNNAVQIQQIRSMIQQGADVIITVAGSGTALNGVIKSAWQQGIPVITLASGVTSPYAINLDENYALHSILMANGVINSIGKKGNVITVQGLSGAPGNVEYETAEKPLFAACPNIKVVANIYGQWANPIAKTQMLTALATHPQQVDGIYQQGGMAQGILQALQQSGRPTGIALTDDGPTAAFMAFWRDNATKGFKGTAILAPPKTQALGAFDVALRVMAGKGLRVNTIVIPSVTVDSSNYKRYLDPSWTFNTDANGEPPTGSFLTDDYLDNFFTQKGAVDWGQGAGI